MSVTCVMPTMPFELSSADFLQANQRPPRIGKRSWFFCSRMRCAMLAVKATTSLDSECFWMRKIY
eukprot:588218-Pleurochrysis_carterae.AAC.4